MRFKRPKELQKNDQTKKIRLNPTALITLPLPFKIQRTFTQLTAPFLFQRTLQYVGAVFILKLKKPYSVEVTATPPYSFELTLYKPAGWWWSTPDEVFENGICWTVTRFQGELVGLKLQSTGTLQKPRITCTFYSRNKLDDSEKQGITRMVKRALKVEENLTEFYKLSQKDNILRGVVEDLYGMHTVGWPELFPALILAVTLQMAPMKRSNQMMDLLIKNFGEQATFDGKAIKYWPSVETITALSVEELKAKAKLGYRAANLIAIAEALKHGFPTMDELWAMAPEEAKKQLLTLRGIGDYSAELVMPRMGFPLDVWSAKIFHVLFFGSTPEKPREAIPALRKVAEERWGDWRGYAFVYVLNDLPKLSKRIGFDLTQF
jgi:DNA-3-methyladenine glycosylase II